MARTFSAAGNQTFRWQTQLFFNDATSLAVIARPPYNARGPRPDTLNGNDRVYMQGGGTTLLATLNVSGTLAGTLSTPGPSLSGTVPPGVYVRSVVARNQCGASATTQAITVTVP
ncbi:MAG TPA: hypothetical protein VEK56_02375 [Vicinamibacterales bacterium]|nr:hypothetical protein [Vicinamibacterales bacterium]